MRFLCPFCSKEKPVPVEVEEGSDGAICPQCKKRFRLRLFQAKSIDAIPRPGGLMYTLVFDQNGRPGIERFSSAQPLALKRGHQFLSVRRGRQVLGLADQDKNFWFPITPAETEHPLLRSLLLSLAWPITVLVLLQLTVLFPALFRSLTENTLSFLLALLLVSLLAASPLLLWILRTIFPYGPRRERIRGYDPRL